MAKNKGGREVRKPKQDKKQKDSAQTMSDLASREAAKDKPRR